MKRSTRRISPELAGSMTTGRCEPREAAPPTRPLARCALRSSSAAAAEQSSSPAVSAGNANCTGRAVAAVAFGLATVASTAVTDSPVVLATSAATVAGTSRGNADGMNLSKPKRCTEPQPPRVSRWCSVSSESDGWATPCSDDTSSLNVPSAAPATDDASDGTDSGSTRTPPPRPYRSCRSSTDDRRPCAANHVNDDSLASRDSSAASCATLPGAKHASVRYLELVRPPIRPLRLPPPGVSPNRTTVSAPSMACPHG